MRLPLSLAALVLSATIALPHTAQAQQPANINQTLSTLADQPASHTGFVFDRTMMQLAQGLLESNGMDAPWPGRRSRRRRDQEHRRRHLPLPPARLLHP